MSIVDRTAVVPKVLSLKSSNKSSTHKQSSRSTEQVVGAGYELVGTRAKAAKRDDGGYVLPSTTNALEAHGYELPGMGKPHHQFDDRTMSSSRPHKKNSFTWLIAVVCLAVVACGMIGVFGFMFYRMLSHKELLPSLTDQCRKAQPANIFQHCAYHRRKYPDSCKSTACDTSFLNYDTQTLAFYIDKTGLKLLTVIEDKTPCGKSKWCQNGLCVATTDSRVEVYGNMKPVDGKWKNHCKEPHCMDARASVRFRDREHCPDLRKGNDSMCTNQKYNVGFRSCTDPPPSHDGKFCDEIDASSKNVYGALYIANFCTKCPGGDETEKSCPLKPMTCISDESNPHKSCDFVSVKHYLRSGRACKMGIGDEAGFCFFKFCLVYDTKLFC